MSDSFLDTLCYSTIFIKGTFSGSDSKRLRHENRQPKYRETNFPNEPRRSKQCPNIYRVRHDSSHCVGLGNNLMTPAQQIALYCCTIISHFRTIRLEVETPLSETTCSNGSSSRPLGPFAWLYQERPDTASSSTPYFTYPEHDQLRSVIVHLHEHRSTPHGFLSE